MRRRACWGGVVGGLLACATPSAPARPARHAVARLAHGSLHHYVPETREGGAIVVLPELGFGHELFAPLSEGLRRRGFELYVPEPDAGLPDTAAWHDLALQAARAAGRGARVLAIGVGGLEAAGVAREGAAKGVVAINVPRRSRVGSVALADALQAGLFQPAAWRDQGRASLLLTGGSITPEADRAAVLRDLRPLGTGLASALALAFARDTFAGPIDVPVRALVSVKDNLVSPEDALAGRDASLVSVRRLGRLELFARDYGHLDWLASDEALDDVLPVLEVELEALR